MILYHYTCPDGAAGIRKTSEIRPAPQPPLPAALAWYSDIYPPIRDALGLTMHTIDCDRTQHAFQIDIPDQRVGLGHSIIWWPDYRRTLKPEARRYAQQLESTRGAMPAHWFVGIAPITIDLQPGSEECFT